MSGTGTIKSQKLLERMNKRQTLVEHEEGDIETGIENKAAIIQAIETPLNHKDPGLEPSAVVSLPNSPLEVASAPDVTEDALVGNIDRFTTVEPNDLVTTLSEFLNNKPPKMEEVYSRKTFWVHNDLLQRMLNITGSERGRQKTFINAALELAIQLSEAKLLSSEPTDKSASDEPVRPQDQD